MSLIAIMAMSQNMPQQKVNLSELMAIEVRGGLNLSTFAGSERWNDYKTGFNAGVIFDVRLTDKWSAKTGMLYTIKGTKGKNDGGFGGDLETTFSVGYLEFLIMGGYTLSKSNKTCWMFDFGLYYAVGLHGKNKKSYSGSNIANDTESEEDVFDYIKQNDLGYHIGPKVILNNRYVLGLSFENSLINISEMGGDMGNRNFSLNVGYRF